MNKTKQILDLIKDHGFEPFANTDDSVSFYMPWTQRIGNSMAFGETLITVSSVKDAKRKLGY